MSEDPVDDLITHPEVVAFVRAILVRRGVPTYSLASTIDAILEATEAETDDEPPTSVAAWCEACHPLAESHSPVPEALPERTNKTDALLYGEDVAKVIRPILKRFGCPVGEREDEVRHVMNTVWAKVKNDPPRVLMKWKRVVRPFARNRGIDLRRKYETRHESGVDAGLTGEPDSYSLPERADAPDLIDLRREIKRIDDGIAQGKLPKETPLIIEGELAGVPQKVIAAEIGREHQWLRHQLIRIRKFVRENPASMFAAAGLAVLAILYVNLHQAPVAHDDLPRLPDAGALPAPSHSAPEVLVNAPLPAPVASVSDFAPAAARERRAEGLRLEAHAAFERGDLTRCHYDIVMVDRLVDAGGDTALGELRKQCETGAREPESILPGTDVQRRQRDGGR